jgi:hypothetical protein
VPGLFAKIGRPVFYRFHSTRRCCSRKPCRAFGSGLNTVA